MQALVDVDLNALSNHKVKIRPFPMAPGNENPLMGVFIKKVGGSGWASWSFQHQK